MKKILSLFIYLSFFSLYSQEAILTGLILDDKNCPQILKANTIVIKVGSSILVDPIKNTLKQDWLNSFLDEIAVLKKNNKND